MVMTWLKRRRRRMLAVMLMMMMTPQTLPGANVLSQCHHPAHEYSCTRPYNVQQPSETWTNHYFQTHSWWLAGRACRYSISKMIGNSDDKKSRSYTVLLHWLVYMQVKYCILKVLIFSSESRISTSKVFSRLKRFITMHKLLTIQCTVKFQPFL